MLGLLARALLARRPWMATHGNLVGTAPAALCFVVTSTDVGSMYRMAGAVRRNTHLVAAQRVANVRKKYLSFKFAFSFLLLNYLGDITQGSPPQYKQP